MNRPGGPNDDRQDRKPTGGERSIVVLLAVAVVALVGLLLAAVAEGHFVGD